MAILDALPGVEVTIESQGNGLPEYADDSEWAQWTSREDYNVRADKWMSTYVECVSDAEFQLKCSIKPPYKMDTEALSFNVSVDGQSIVKVWLTKNSGPVQSETVATSYELAGPHEAIRKALKFASIQKLDEADSSRVNSDAETAVGIGEIKVCIYRSSLEDLTLVNDKPLSKPLRDAPTEIAEKALKGRAISHGISFGGEKREVRNKKTAVFVDGRRNPIGILVFKYRSREALRQEHIIPRSPSPIVVMSPLSPQNENENQLMRERRIAKLQRELESLEAEPKVKDENDPRGQKRSADDELVMSRQYKTIRKRNGTLVYDLTDDD